MVVAHWGISGGQSASQSLAGWLAGFVQEEVAAPFVRLIALLVRQEGPLVAEYMNDFKVGIRA